MSAQNPTRGNQSTQETNMIAEQAKFQLKAQKIDKYLSLALINSQYSTQDVEQTVPNSKSAGTFHYVSAPKTPTIEVNKQETVEDSHVIVSKTACKY